MTTYESDIKYIIATPPAVYQKLSDLSSLDSLIEKLPTEQKDKIQNVTCDADSVSFLVQGMNVTLRIVDREENKTIKFGIENLPIQGNFWIQILPASETQTKMKLTLKADLPMMVKMMVGSKLGDAVNQLATVLSSIPY